MKYYDTIIVGAGLAGCTLGNILLSKNQSVIILENQDLKKKNKLCGGIITAKAYNILFKIYGNKLEKINFRKFNSFKVKNKGVTKEVNNQTIYTIYRKDLDDFVINEFLENGGQIIDNVNYEKIDFKNNIIYICNEPFKYNNLVGADGVFSKVRKDLTGKVQKMNFAIETEIFSKDESIEIAFLDYFKGYTWRIPNNKNSLIGLGDVSKNKVIKNTFLNYFNLNETNYMRGAFLPSGDDIFLKKRNTFLIGDAAGLASPAIGEGIYYALSSAYCLSKSMNALYIFRMWKNKFIIFSHRISKTLIYNTFLRNFFYKLYGKSKIASFLIELVLKTLL